MRRLEICILAAAATFAAAGCGGPDASAITGSKELVSLKGKVSIRGKPVTNGEVSFRASNINRPDAPLRSAQIGKDGAYSIDAYIGPNFVAISCKELSTPKNAALLENEQLVTINSGAQILDINLPTKGSLETK